MPIGSHKDKFIFQSQNLLIFFKNFRKRKFRKFPEFWSNLQKFILQNKEFSEHTKVYRRIFFRFCHLQKLRMLSANISTNAIKSGVLRKMKLLYSQKFISGKVFSYWEFAKVIYAKLKNFAIFRTCESFSE